MDDRELYNHLTEILETIKTNQEILLEIRDMGIATVRDEHLNDEEQKVLDKLDKAQTRIRKRS